MILGPNEHIGDAIVQLRTNRGMTRGDLARAAGVHVRTLGRIENKEHFNPNWDMVLQILRQGLNVNIEFTYRGPEDEEDPSDLA